MEISVVVHQMVQFFIIMAVGYILYKAKIIDDVSVKKITKLVLECTLPLMVLSSVLDQPAERDYSAVLVMMFISAAFYLLVPLISLIIVKLMRMPADQQGMYALMLTLGNVGFMGFPVLNSLYGSTAVFYAAIMNIFFNLSTFSIGVMLVNYRREDAGGTAEFNFKSIISPGTVISVCSIVIYFTGIVFPDDVVSVCSSLGSVTSPLAMLIIGATLATMDIKSVFSDWRIYPFTVVKQIVLPFVLWLVFRLFIHDEMMLGVCTVLAMMPVANICVMMANRYDRNEQLAARGVFITTLFALVSVPAMMYFIM